MNQLKRRPLGNKSGSNNQGSGSTSGGSNNQGGDAPEPGNSEQGSHSQARSPQQGQQNRGGQQRPQRPRGRGPQQQQRQGQNQNNNQSQGGQNRQGQGQGRGGPNQPNRGPGGASGPNQQNRPNQGRPQQGGRPNNQQGGRQQGGRPQHNNQPRRVPTPPPPPAYFQRDLLLVVKTESAKAIDEVRTKFDPLVKKVPAHVTLLLPEPAGKLSTELLKSLGSGELPSLQQLTFSSVIVHKERYLYLMPDDESRQKVMAWRQAALEKLTEHTQEEDYMPHLTLGYVPRSIPPEDAVTHAQTLISLPVIVEFEKVLLEEFGENQISKPVDIIGFGSVPEVASAPAPASESAPTES